MSILTLNRNDVLIKLAFGVSSRPFISLNGLFTNLFLHLKHSKHKRQKQFRKKIELFINAIAIHSNDSQLEEYHPELVSMRRLLTSFPLQHPGT